MLDKYYHTKEIYYTHEKMVAYLRGELEDYEKRAMEKLIEEDTFLKDALEGIQIEGLASSEKSIQRIQKKTDILSGARKPFTISMRTKNLAIAAMLLVFMAAGWLIVTKLNVLQTEQTAFEPTEQQKGPELKEEITIPELTESTDTEAEKVPEQNKPKNDIPPPETKIADEAVEEAVTEPVTTISLDMVEEDADFVELASPSQTNNSNSGTVKLDDRKKSVGKESRSADQDAYLSGTPASSVDKENTVFTIAETMPEYPGGDKALQSYLKEQIRYPASAKEASIQGTVYMSFIVEPNGELTHVNVVKGIGSGCDKEAVRVISGMPQWKPAKQDGNAVRVMMNLPVQFRLN